MTTGSCLHLMQGPAHAVDAVVTTADIVQRHTPKRARFPLIRFLQFNRRMATFIQVSVVQICNR